MATRLEDLERLRELLWESINAADVDKRAALAARIESVAAQIDALAPTVKVGDPVDEIAERRATRGAGTAASKRRASSD